MFKLMDKKIIIILRKLFLLNWPYDFNGFIAETRSLEMLTDVKIHKIFKCKIVKKFVIHQF